MGQVTLTGNEFILVLILVKLGVMASLTSVLVRSRRFLDMMFTRRRSPAAQAGFALALGLPFSIGVLLRLLLGYEALDLAFAGAYVAGLVGGIHPGLLVGAMVGVPGLLMGEWLAMPAHVVVGTVAGLVGGGRLAGDWVWDLTPVPPMDVFRGLKTAVLQRTFDRRLLVVGSCLGLAIVYDVQLSWAGQGWFYRLQPTNPWVMVAVWTGTLSSVGIAIKVFDAARMDRRIKAQEALLTQARFEALRRQINPHFLFNTLNTISSSIRTNSAGAREMIIKLAAILRRVLQPGEDFVPLREEIEFIDAYLDIETVRFGPDRLLVTKEIDPGVLDVTVPPMILQPLVENAILHGLAPAIEPGTITIRARTDNGAVVVSIEDDGRGMSTDRIEKAGPHSIGIRNVHERLQVAYGGNFGVELISGPGLGTCVRVRVPDRRSRRDGTAA